MGCTKIIYDLLPEKLFMGYGEEQLSRTLTFDISQMQAELPGGVPMIAYMRPRDELGYLASGVTLDGSTLTWELSAHVMQYKGIGGAQIVLVDESGEETHILKSHVMQMLIGSSIPLTGGEPPEPWETWLEQILAAAARAESAAADAEAQADRAETAEAGAQQALIDAGSPVIYGRAQTLTDAQQQTARGNIAAASAADVSDLKSDLQYKTDNVYGGNTTPSSVSITNGKQWVDTTGLLQDSTKRGSSDPIIITPDMANITVSTGYVMLVYGNNEGYGHTLNLIQTYTPNAITIDGVIEYKYIYIVVARSDIGVITGDDLTNVIKINKYTEVIPYLTENDLPLPPENYDYFFVKNGKLICFNQPVNTTNNSVAKYALVDMGDTVKKCRCKFTQRGGGNVTLISTTLNTDNHIQNIVNKSIHCVFGLTQVNVQTFDNGIATTIASYQYTLNSDDETEYEIGFEIVDNTTLKVLTPDGIEHSVSHDFTSANGRYFIFEIFSGNMNPSASPTTDWNRASIVSVYCKANSGHAYRDTFYNYLDGLQPSVSPSGHVYTLFRNVNANDSTYINANGTHDA